MRTSVMTGRSSLVSGIVILLAGCGGEPAHDAATEVVAVRRVTLPADPAAPAWADVPAYRATLLLQDMVEPRLLAPSTPEVRVQAMTDGTRVAFRLDWPDATRDDLPDTGRFSDACAVQLPGATRADVPAPQMGEAGRPVEITYWRAYWQAMVDGRPDTIAAIHPGAAIDHYPFEAPSLKEGTPEQEAMARRYAPARALENRMAGPRRTPVEDLVAEGPGTLHPAPAARGDGRGTRTATGWTVVLSRPLPGGITGSARTQVAFAVWDGAHAEVGARKMRTAWIPLVMEDAP
jgi:DMSO reductase family type II enzyme heme b subunit